MAARNPRRGTMCEPPSVKRIDLYCHSDLGLAGFIVAAAPHATKKCQVSPEVHVMQAGSYDWWVCPLCGAVWFSELSTHCLPYMFKAEAGIEHIADAKLAAVAWHVAVCQLLLGSR